jgi:hypothetical protein
MSTMIASCIHATRIVRPRRRRHRRADPRGATSEHRDPGNIVMVCNIEQALREGSDIVRGAIARPGVTAIARKARKGMVSAIEGGSSDV